MNSSDVELVQKLYPCGINDTFIDVELQPACYFPWVAEAVLPCFLSSFGLANSSCNMEILVEGASNIKTAIAQWLFTNHMMSSILPSRHILRH